MLPSSTPATDLLHALQADARLYGEEVACEVARLTPHDCTQQSLSQVWDRIQDAMGALFEALGGRHMGDYAPDLEAVSRAMTLVGAWYIVALQIAGQMGDSGGDAA